MVTVAYRLMLSHHSTNTDWPDIQHEINFCVHFNGSHLNMCQEFSCVILRFVELDACDSFIQRRKHSFQ
jgi:hypothetical protein